ncbi:hypothetical protein GF336_00180 [Candidatus Woesearchaeota archaeon]|nr:hypothetical protein [Candidatus Woesearchaeota archaeon]
MENKAFKIAGIKNLMKTNYGIENGLLDIESLVDDNLSMSENWYNMKEKVILFCPKKHKILFN